MTWHERARRWLEGDPDSGTRSELERLLDAGDEEALGSCFEPPLEFGTAGLRGTVGPGPARMNRAVIRRVSWALGMWLEEAGLLERPVVVGFDARPESRTFAEDTAGVLTARGVEVLLFPEPCPTPWVAFACRALRAAAGVVVTASHNPRGDNGYKVYDDQGIQIVSPWDTRIAELLGQAPCANQIPLFSGRAQPVPAKIIDEYFRPLESACIPEGRPLRVAYTALHGVGLASTRRALEASGRVTLSVVQSQAEPDGAFPTVAFPNPEEPGAVDALLELAAENKCDLALAHDPDADRLAVCVFDRTAWRRLSGDEVGILLADHLLRRFPAEGTPVVASSIVSSPMLDLVAESYGARVAHCLTGFKWLCRVPAHLKSGERFVFGYEEALGYAVDPRVLDKDGISAAVCFVELAEELRARGKSVAEHLLELYLRHGLWVSCPTSVRLAGAAQGAMSQALERLREHPPRRVAGFPVVSVVDYQKGAELRPAYLGTQNLVQLELGQHEASAFRGGRVLVRPSGTEPKVKFYVHVWTGLASAAELSDTHEALLGCGREMARELCEAVGLGPS